MNMARGRLTAITVLPVTKVFVLLTVMFALAISSDPINLQLSPTPESSTSSSSSSLPSSAAAVNEEKRGNHIIGFDLLSHNLLQNSNQVEKNYPYGWRFSQSFQGIRLSPENSTSFLSGFRGDFLLKFSGVLSPDAAGVLLLVKKGNDSLPYIDVAFDITKNVIVLRYLGTRSFERVKFERVFPDSRWLELEFIVQGKEVTINVDCQVTGSAHLRQKIGAIPESADVIFGGSDLGQSGLKGMVFSASLFFRSNAVRTCGMQSDAGEENQVLELGSGFTLSSSSTESNLEARIIDLEKRLMQLSLIVENLSKENSGLSSRVAHLETCECHPSCSFNGTVFQEGESWTPNDCTQCKCVNNRPVCEQRFDLPACADPCLSSPCLNNGECLNIDRVVGSFQCECPSPFDGAVCERKQNPRAWPLEPGNCDQQIVRYYYDKMSQQCLPFKFSGCGGNVNNYHNLEECTTIALRGACCYRTYKTNIADVVKSTQELEIKCQELHIIECKALHRQPSGDETETEVISFNPGLTCSEAACQTVETCVVGQRVYSPGDTIRLGCQECQCKSVGQIKCKCEKMTVRKEIRDMSPGELLRFQKAVADLRNSEDRTWEQFRDLYMYHVMHASNGPFFLPWQRTFLRQIEQRLQQIDCDVVLPYFDFTTDVGFFEEAVIWQANYFGGNGNGGCVEDHQFGPKNIWQPCFVRNFNTSIQLPTQVELHLALVTEDYEEMSLSLETYVAYVHNFIGGDMMTSSSPYDPVFYPIHAYIDMLYWTWQQKNQNKFKFPAAYGSIPMIPFNIPPWAVFDSETDLCVNYTLPSEGDPCNITTVEHRKPGIKRADIDPKDLYGYDQEELGKKNFILHGFDKSGFNKDGYDHNGYDIEGYNRYGFNTEGYDRYGYNMSGVDASGNIDNTGRFDSDGYDTDCLNRQGMTKEGLDQYGFYLNGLDKNGCSYYFRGPFCPLHSFRIFSVLSQQPHEFLLSIPRTCTGLSPLPDHWLELNWLTTIKDATDVVHVNIPDMQTGVSSRFCFDTQPFLSSCDCDSVSCETNPCFNSTCRSFPEAKCRFSFCGDCTAKWYHSGKEVDCEQTRDYCNPNPCMNGGTCLQSLWLKEPSLINCKCPPGFDGSLCQHVVLDPCILPRSSGSCESQETRWHYNQHSGRCEEFIYSGCGGNANNFRSILHCQSQCEKGACCSRQPQIPSLTIGFDNQGYDKYGFNEKGYNLFGSRRTVDNSFALSKFRFDEKGFDWQGFNREGFGSDGFDRAGYDQNGFDSDGFNITGYSRIGEYDGVIDYSPEGFDKDGFNRAGFSCHGNDRNGFDQFGVGGAYTYSCDITTLARCQERSREGEEIIKFSPGKSCEEVECAVPCGCRHGNQTFSIYQQFQLGCQTCSCTEKGIILCVCDFGITRKEIREMSRDEISRYQLAIRRLHEDTGFPSEWYKFASLYAIHKPQAVGNSMFLPWNRQFLRYVEQAIQNIDCGVAIPYYDWTVDAGKPYKSLIWAANVMGGNGDEMGCVRYHPFKSYHKLYLSPCFRRQFNISISLPSVVNIELALQEPDYDRFRLQVEMFARIYQGFVGGHMDSDFAPYDPLYYSVMAFIDKLWTDWQDRHPEGLLSFPLHYRYARMDPFKSTPDDVFDSRIQLCVDYLPVTEGVPCNVSVIRTFDYDAQGYDRHGFSRQGYDKDGFNIEGFDSTGNPDTRGIYNKLGFDKEGFKRSGFDDSGIDRYGFYFDSYNLDDFDARGYDRSGYNRYGFNQEGLTPYGFHINGTYLLKADIQDIKIFDSFGYNKYGYNQEGFDRNGYDIFGFDYRGFDHRLCNYYFLGPIHMLVKQYVSKTLMDLNVTVLTNLKRICPQLSPFPDSAIVGDWFDRYDQKSLLDALYQQQIQTHVVDLDYTPRETSVATDLIWLPIPPDERLCLVTEVYTHCQLGEPHLICPEDLCEGRVCPGYSTAVCWVRSCGECTRQWYDGISGISLDCSGCVEETGNIRNEGETWSPQPCSSCVCFDGRVNCLPTECPQVRCQYPVMLPDQCCPSCEGCDYQGRKVLSGSEFRIPDDACSLCVCEKGNVRCSPLECPSVAECKNVIKSEGQCCPVCQDCGDHEHGDTWKQSPCQECMCQAGHVNCTDIVCASLNCDHPYNAPGECCPQCSQCLYKNKVYRDGEEFSLDPCTSCSCVNGSVKCGSVQCDPADCGNPVTLPGQCCSSCGLECQYGGKTYADESTFHPEYNPCLNCSCSNSIVRCRPVRCETSDLPCRTPIRRAGECCPSLCPSCEDQGVEHFEGETWPSHNSPCDQCYCQGGKVVCQPRSDCPLKCSHGVVKPGECCSQCTDCLFEGRIVTERDTHSFSVGDVCRLCTCNAGEMNCLVINIARECPRLRCEKTETLPGECCPVCAGCVSGERKFQHGEEISQNECSRCICSQGEILCETKTADCPPALCPEPRKTEGQCCPVCESCIYYGQEYKEGVIFISPTDPCKRCICDGGKVTCTSLHDECPPTACTHPGRRRDQCCLQCDSCLYLGRPVRNGQRFGGNDSCQICSCQDGSITCISQKCPPVRCSNPVTLPGRCCPVCNGGCVVEGREYKEEESFKRPGMECSTCVCEHGQIKCNGANCEHPACSHPATLPGECCPKCNFCLFEKRIFRNQQRFVHPNSLCQQCSCDFGSVTCTETECENLTCPNPTSVSGSCCPACPKQCAYNGLNYNDGGTFVNPSNKCEDCLCRQDQFDCTVCNPQGTVQCKQRMCPRVDCANPVNDGCCPVCKDCTFGVLLLVDGEEVPNPNDPCQICRCVRGSVQCRGISCPPVTCANPAQVGCCPVCQDCEYRGHRYDNGATVIADTDRCRTCKCQDGTVHCQINPCPPVTCHHPFRGQCCNECENCHYQGVGYRDGEKFPDPDPESCKECICTKGNVVCTKKVCPVPSCSHPAQGSCCPECHNCAFSGQTIRESDIVSNPSDSCEECQCRQGSIVCYRKRCPSKYPCRHPIERGCCKECTGCFYGGKEYRHAERFNDPATNCVICGCANGDVFCQQRTCPQTTCSHPVQGECCMECSGCYYNSQKYGNGQRFPHLSDQCQECQCRNGDISCFSVDCSSARSCTHPVSLPGECCPVCGQDCFVSGQLVRSGDRFSNNCQECTCLGGNIRCTPKSCPPINCTNPALIGCCQSCAECSFNHVNYQNGQIFPHARDPCSKCTCKEGSVLCERQTCMPTKCSHPAQGLCCPECNRCEYTGHLFSNGQQFADQSDKCSTCVCENGTVSCSSLPCTQADCSNPDSDECGCPVCNGCSYQGLKMADGQSLPSLTDQCQECLCKSGTVTCNRKPCSANCSHPAVMMGCCSRCDDCLYEDQVRINRQQFVSHANPCQKCQCQQGSVICQTMECEELTCSNPVKMDGECCPSCPMCVLLGQMYQDGERFKHPDDSCQICSCKMGHVDCESEKCVSQCTHPGKGKCCPQCDECLFEGYLYDNGNSFEPDACHSCQCKNGNVHCSELTCPTLSCPETVHVEGQCCEVCRGCTFYGILYSDNATWVMPDNPCISCTCNRGIVTCMEEDCYVPCSAPVTLPGQCCPVCPTCNFDGHQYVNGEGFTPDGDPCNHCQCTDGFMKCLHRTCPSVANCPAESLRQPESGGCCPTCDDSFSSGCSEADLGKITRPRPNDPCFFCECKEDFIRVCMKKECPPLSCPPDVQLYSPSQCCPSCPACQDLAEAKYHHEGSTWSSREDPCIVCTCKNAEIKCSIQECEPISCSSTERAVKPEGHCCEMCQPVPDATCYYEGKAFQPAEEWTVDECTSCRCLGGRMICSVRQCSLTQCSDDEALVTTPGNCCPVCQKRPGTCLVFGDPHYRTFDGVTLHFQGTCKYIMASDCDTDLFRVEVQHDSRGMPGEVSWAQNLTVTVAGTVIDLLQDRVVKVNGRLITPPFLYEPHILIEESGKSVLLSTEIGLRILWDGFSYGELTVPGSFKHQLCGLCGNFNDFPQDDMRTRSGQITSSPAAFGNSWKASTQIGEGCIDAIDIDPCAAAGYRIRKLAASRCAILKSETFARCHRVVSPEPFFSSCVYDLCVCLENSNCLCDILGTYAHECARSGVRVEWRTSNLCAFECDTSKGLMFDECGPVCPRTCESIQVVQANMTETCFKPCVASCQCTADKVLHGGRCISPQDCPYIETVPIL